MDARSLKKNFIGAVIAVAALFFAATGATFAWYVYNTSVHTTDVRLAAGAGISLEISREYAGEYGSAIVLEPFEGYLTPVSTNSIRAGFQKDDEWHEVEGRGDVAFKFRASESSDYFKTSLWLRTRGESAQVYISDIGFEDEKEGAPISTAIRVGFVVHSPGENGAETDEFIFSISDARNPLAKYNTEQGVEGHVLDSSRTDGATVPFRPYNSANYAEYDRSTGFTTLKPDSVPLFTLPEGGNRPGESVRVDVYIWLEGCDEDCTSNLSDAGLKDIAIQFSATPEE